MALEVRATLKGYATRVQRTRWLAWVTIGWLAVLGIERLFEVALQLWTDVDSYYFFELSVLDDTASMVLPIVTAGWFLCWLASVVRVTNALSAQRLPWGPLASVVAFFVPIANFVWPCAVLMKVYAALRPAAVPEPHPRAFADSSTGYRGVRWAVLPRAPALPRASVPAWWVMFCLGYLLRRFGACCPEVGSCLVEHHGEVAASVVASVVDAVAIVLAIVMIRAITARLVERMRRIQCNDEDVVGATGIVLP